MAVYIQGLPSDLRGSEENWAYPHCELDGETSSALKHPGLRGVLEIDDMGDYQKFLLNSRPSGAPVVSSGLAVNLDILGVKRWTLYVMNARESKLSQSQLADNYLKTLPGHTHHENTIHLYRIIILSFSLQYPTTIFMSLTYHYISISH